MSDINDTDPLGGTILMPDGTREFVQEDGGKTIKVTNVNDSGAGSLRDAIAQASGAPGRTTIDLSPVGGQTIELESTLWMLRRSTIDFKGDAHNPTEISGGNTTDLFYVGGGGHLRFSHLIFSQGLGEGGDGVGGGGGGLGSGAAITIRNGEVDLLDTTFTLNEVHGGDSLGRAGNGGNGGRGTVPVLAPRDGADGGKSGGFQNIGGVIGGDGGAATLKDGERGENGLSGSFGVGGSGAGGGGGGYALFGKGMFDGGYGGIGGTGGFGAGGGGGGGGGGGAQIFDSYSGRGLGGLYGRPGAFAGWGEDGVGLGRVRSGGHGGEGGGGAGLGGAIFVDAGAELTVVETRFIANDATGGSGGADGQGKGGAIFALQGSLVSGARLSFIGNTASDAVTDKFAGYDVHQDSNDVYGTIYSRNPYPDAIIGTEGNDKLGGTAQADYIFGDFGSDAVSGMAGNDMLVGGAGQDTFVFRPGDGTDYVADFTSLTRAPSDERAADGDVLKFDGAGLTVRNLLLSQNGDHTEIAFEGVPGLHVTVAYTVADGLANLGPGQGNILFDGESTFRDSFDIIPDKMQINAVLRPGVVTFLNDANNVVEGSGVGDVINGGAGDDVITGEAGNDLLRGGAGDDVLQGGSGDDTLVGGAGDDQLDGTDGFNVAVYSAAAASYRVSLDPSGSPDEVIVAGPDGTDTVTAVESLQFSDKAFDVTLLTAAGSLSAPQFASLITLYSAYLQRAPDALGLTYWASQLAGGMSLDSVARSFFASAEAVSTRPAGQTASEFVAEAYADVLGRSPDAPGLNYWLLELQEQRIARDVLPMALALGAAAGSPDGQYLENVVMAGAHFALERGLTDATQAADIWAITSKIASSVSAANALTDGFAAEAALNHSQMRVELIGVEAQLSQLYN